MKNAHKSLILIALGSALAMPVAFAQDAAAKQDSMQAAPTTTEQAPPAAEQAAPANDAKKVTWADLDADKDGSLSKSEAAQLASLSQVFDQADTDANGKLTADEYKAFVAKNGNSATDKQG
ncbi:MAG: EF-hand domain-containing protein [Luteimonas sp.]